MAGKYNKKDAEKFAVEECDRRNEEVSDLLNNGFSRMMKNPNFSLFFQNLKIRIESDNPDVILVAQNIDGCVYNKDQKTQVLLLKFDDLKHLRRFYYPPYSDCNFPKLQFTNYHLAPYFDRELDFMVFSLGVASYFSGNKIQVKYKCTTSDSSPRPSRYNHACTGGQEIFANSSDFKSWLSEYLSYHTLTWKRTSRYSIPYINGKEYPIQEGMFTRGGAVYVIANSHDTLVEECCIERRERIEATIPNWY